MIIMNYNNISPTTLNKLQNFKKIDRYTISYRIAQKLGNYFKIKIEKGDRNGSIIDLEDIYKVNYK